MCSSIPILGCTSAKIHSKAPDFGSVNTSQVGTLLEPFGFLFAGLLFEGALLMS